MARPVSRWQWDGWHWQAARSVFEPPRWTHSAMSAAETERIAAMVLQSIERDGWLSGLPLGVESPGLMTGLAGIGYGLLRLAAPERVPALLLLAPPIAADLPPEPTR
jgi:hypothetical protein